MAILGIGIDVLHTPRIATLFRRRGPRLASRILSEEEHNKWLSLPVSNISHLTHFFAVRWSIKEAAYKAMYPIVRPTWKELSYRELGQGPSGIKPSLVYHPNVVAEFSKVGRIHISVSHDGEYVFTSVTVEYPEQKLPI